MISVIEAKELILRNCEMYRISEVSLPDAVGCILAESITSPIDNPPFNQSNMDGYGFSFEHWDQKSELIVTGEIQTGNYSAKKIKPLEAVRIYTGAPLPPGTDTVVVQEKVVVNQDKIFIKDTDLKKGVNVRLQGSQSKINELVLENGRYINAPSVSFLAGLGIEKVKVFTKPSVSIIVTGNELINAGEVLTPGKIYESNSLGLTAALAQIGIMPYVVDNVDDDENRIMNLINKNLHNDIIILTGGASVGEYDFVCGALNKCEVKQIFHKVKQKPGKPFYFGRKADTLIFALLGNPAAVMTCFYEYIIPAIRKFIRKEQSIKSKLPLTNDFTKTAGLTYFLKGKISGDGVGILSGQESYRMDSFAIADCIIELKEEKECYKKGDWVEINMIG